MNTVFYQQIFSEYLKKTVEVKEVTSLSGGCINKAVRVVTSDGIFCVKTNQASSYPQMFEKEAKGLSELKKTKTIYVPEPIFVGEQDGIQYIILEFIKGAPRIKNFWEDFGHSLARMHTHTAPAFGLDFDNYIGSLPQRNAWNKNWIHFFIENRLEPQLKLAARSGYVDQSLQNRFENLYKKLPDLLPESKPCLIHGDLWSGNFMVGPEGKAVLIDPATYYGVPEAELGFTRLFGGFDEEFYEAYLEVNKMEPGYEDRMELYNLYPLLVHVNLFGSGYLSGVNNILIAYS